MFVLGNEAPRGRETHRKSVKESNVSIRSAGVLMALDRALAGEVDEHWMSLKTLPALRRVIAYSFFYCCDAVGVLLVHKGAVHPCAIAVEGPINFLRSRKKSSEQLNTGTTRLTRLQE